MPQPDLSRDSTDSPRTATLSAQSGSAVSTPQSSSSGLLLQRRISMSRPLTVPNMFPQVLPECNSQVERTDTEVPVVGSRRKYHSADMAVLIHSFSTIDLHEKLIEAKSHADGLISTYLSELEEYMAANALSLGEGSLVYLGQLEDTARVILHAAPADLRYVEALVFVALTWLQSGKSGKSFDAKTIALARRTKTICRHWTRLWHAFVVVICSVYTCCECYGMCSSCVYYNSYGCVGSAESRRFNGTGYA